MALIKKFITDVAVIIDGATHSANRLHNAGQYAVNKAFCDKVEGLEYVTHLVNSIPVYFRKPLTSWLNKAGIEVLEVAGFNGVYNVVGIKKDANQSKIQAWVKLNTIVALHESAKKEKATKPKVLVGTLAERAKKALLVQFKKAQTSDDQELQDVLTAFIRSLNKDKKNIANLPDALL